MPEHFNFGGLPRPTKVYDVDQTDPTKKLLGEFPSIKAAANFSGVTPAYLHNCLSRKTRVRPETNSLNTTITFR